jgi:membrane protease YdiL (CAAX protease family)
VGAFLPYLLLIFLGEGQEELGWRGYILDPLDLERLKQ